MLRAIVIALSGLVYFIISIALMMPLRMMKEPIENYNLFFVPFLAVVLGFLFYRCCTEETQHKAYTYGFFAGIVAWQLFGELASMPVDKGVITQFSNVNIKLHGGYFYLAGAWVALKILWRTESLKNPIAVFFLTFLSIWTFELYMDNYSVQVPVELMPTISYTVGIIAVILSVLLLVIARKSPEKTTQTVMGCLLYITLSLALMGFSSWTKPQAFYVKYEAKHIDHEIEALTAQRAYIKQLRLQMIASGQLEPETETTEVETTPPGH